MVDFLLKLCNNNSIAVEADRIARASKTPGNGFDSRQLHHN